MTEHLNGGAPESRIWLACSNLLARANIQALSINWTRSGGAHWWASCIDSAGNRLTEHGLGPTMALAAITERVASTCRCECGRPIAISDRAPQGCRWRLEGTRFVSGHTGPSIQQRRTS
jgi:hypothetical protein